MVQKKTVLPYARALMELGQENVVDELSKIMNLIDQNRNLETLFFLDVFTTEEKLSVFSEIAKKVSLDKMVRDFVKFLFVEKRIFLLPPILKEVMVLNDHNKGIVRGTLSGRDQSPNAKLVGRIKEFLQKELEKEVKLVYKHSGNITAGYRATVEDLMLDASLDYQLERFRESTLIL